MKVILALVVMSILSFEIVESLLFGLNKKQLRFETTCLDG